MEDINWQKRAEFYKKQLDDLKVNRFNLQNELKKKDLEIANERKMRKNHYRKMTEFRQEVISLLNKKLNDWD
tara:strand:+ start:993 stop:1208 length:216 start_codon:yes stop_codon:yes gene_type:complete